MITNQSFPVQLLQSEYKAIKVKRDDSIRDFDKKLVELQEAIDVLIAQMNNPNALKEHLSVAPQVPTDMIATSDAASTPAVDIIADYDSTQPWRIRILYALNQLGNAYVTDITKYIIEKQPELDETSVMRKVTRVASDLNIAGRIQAKKESNRNLYSMK